MGRIVDVSRSEFSNKYGVFCMEEKKKRNVVRRSVLTITMVLVLPAVFITILNLFGLLGTSINAVLFAWFAKKTTRFIGIAIIVIIYTALSIWVLKRNYGILSKIVILLIVLTVFLSFLYFAFCFYSYMTDPGFR